MAMPANAASGTPTAVTGHGAGVDAHTSASAPDPLLKLARERGALESGSNGWGAFLVVASIVVAIGVILQVAEDVFEIAEAIKNKRRILWRKQLVLCGSILAISGVIAEVWAEVGSGDVETKLRANNAAMQGVLDARARRATQSAVDTANNFGGLQNLVEQRQHDTSLRLGELQHSTDMEIGRQSYQISQSIENANKRNVETEIQLENIRNQSEDAFSIARDASSRASFANVQVRKQLKALQDMMKEEKILQDQVCNNLRATPGAPKEALDGSPCAPYIGSPHR